MIGPQQAGLDPKISASRGMSLFTSEPWKHVLCAIVESPSEIKCLDLKMDSERTAASDFPNGVAFSEDSEIRWMTRSGVLHSVLISDRGLLLDNAFQQADLTVLPRSDRRVYLWGKQDNDGVRLREDRIPRLFRLGPRSESKAALPVDFIYPVWAPRPKRLGRLAIGMRGYQMSVRVPYPGPRETEEIERTIQIYRLDGFVAEDS